MGAAAPAVLGFGAVVSVGCGAESGGIKGGSGRRPKLGAGGGEGGDGTSTSLGSAGTFMGFVSWALVVAVESRAIGTRYNRALGFIFAPLSGSTGRLARMRAPGVTAGALCDDGMGPSLIRGRW